MSAKSEPSQYRVTQETSEGTPLRVSDGERDYDVKTGGDHQYFVDDDDGNTVGSFDDRD